LKKLFIVFLCLVFATLCFADNTPIIDDDLTITLPDIIYHGSTTNYTAVLKYNPNGYWYLHSLVQNTLNLNVDAYGFDADAFLAEINYYRVNGAPCSAGGLSPVAWDQQLADASLGHSADMAINNYFSHTGLDGSTPWVRVSQAGFTGSPLGENISAGYSTVNDAVVGWINSSGHCANIMNSQATHMGYGWARKSGSQWGTYHTMLTGRKY
jgi:uncharacterized protein YkwD